jgi:hypothetical protein
MSIAALDFPMDDDDDDNDETLTASVIGNPNSVATLSRPWQYDDFSNQCSHCHTDFTALERRHHCRSCGQVFCNRCSDQRCLIPPSSIVLVPKGGKKASILDEALQSASFSPDTDPDRMLTFLSPQKELLYGKGLEERFK